MATDPEQPFDSGDVQAAELALGLLDGEERGAALRRVLHEHAFAIEVERWRLYFAQLFDLWPEATPPEGLIDRIDLSLGGPSPTRARRLPWPLLAIVSSAIAAVLLVVVALRPGPPPAPAPQPAPTVIAAESGPLLVAGIAAEKQAVGALYQPDSGTLRVAASTLAPKGRVAQLWVIGGGEGAKPYPLGLLGGAVTVIHLSPADRARIAAGATLAISIEPPGGSPTGQPTGPVVGTGGLTAV